MFDQESDTNLLATASKARRRSNGLVTTNDEGFLPYDPSTDRLAMAAAERKQAMANDAESRRQGTIKQNQDTGGKVGGILGTIVGSVYGQPEAGNQIGKAAGGSLAGIASGSLQDKNGNYTFDSIKSVLDQADMGQGLIDQFTKKKKGAGQHAGSQGLGLEAEGLGDLGSGGADAMGSMDLGTLAELGSNVA